MEKVYLTMTQILQLSGVRILSMLWFASLRFTAESDKGYLYYFTMTSRPTIAAIAIKRMHQGILKER